MSSRCITFFTKIYGLDRCAKLKRSPANYFPHRRASQYATLASTQPQYVELPTRRYA
jgi:hypothetical protein